MAVNFVAQKCACGGKLEFNPAKKVWICKYCGTVVEREATFDRVHVDGIEGIDDIVRQTLMDIANHRMESAAKNLDDCERKGHKHIGTLLANVCFYLASISGAKSQDEARANIDKVKIYGGRLKQEFSTIGAEEINLYESFGDDSSDIFANLLVSFDTLGDEGRVEYISSKLKPERVFSPHVNKSLLKVSIRTENFEVVDRIVNNIGHIDKKASFQEILENYPCNEKKEDYLRQLFDDKIATELTKRYFENYFATSKDDIAIKSAVVDLLNNTDIHVNAEIVVKNSLDQLSDYEKAKQLFDSVYGVKISDQETEALMLLCLMVNKLFEVQNAFFDTLKEKEVYVALNARAVISFLDSTPFYGENKSIILGKMISFNLDSKSLDAIYNYYLNNNKDDIDTRQLVIEKLLVPGAPLSTNTIKTYVVKITTDADSKIDVVRRIIETGINKTYVNDLLSDYMLHSEDSESVKKGIFDYLASQGFKTDASVLSKFISDPAEKGSEKVDKIKQLVLNGTQIKSDTIDTYICSIVNPDDFSEELFNLLTANSYSVAVSSYCKFLLLCKDADKIRHNEVLIRGISGDLNSSSVEIEHCGNKVSCNVFQAYLLNAVDSYDVAAKIVERFNNLKVKTSTEIMVNGNRMKFKKYVAENKDRISPLSLKLCEENRVFSLF